MVTKDYGNRCPRCSRKRKHGQPRGLCKQCRHREQPKPIDGVVCYYDDDKHDAHKPSLCEVENDR